MQSIRLERLTLRHFKGIREFTLTPGGGDVAVYGDNATGKTTIADAFAWLLFGRDSLGQADFRVKTLDANGRAIHHLDHEVAAAFRIDGTTLELRRVLAEKWTKRRGSAAQEFDGHETRYWVDGVPVQDGDFKSRVARLAAPETVRLLTDPGYFAGALHWQKRRALLLEVCGQVPDADVVASDVALADLPGILGTRKLDDHRKVLAARRTEINRELDRIPVRIDEATRALPETVGDAETIRGKAAILRRERQAIEAERVGLLAGNAIAEVTRRLRTAEAAMQEVLTRQAREENAQQRQRDAGLREARNRQDDARRRVRNTQREEEERAAEAARLEVRLQVLRAEWAAIQEETMPLEALPADTCPACGQSLPEESVEAARQKALAEANLRRAQRLQVAADEGKRVRGLADALRSKGEFLASELQQAQEAAQTADAAAAALETESEAPPTPILDADYRRHRAAAAAAQAEIDNLQAGQAASVGPLQERIAELDGQLAALEAMAARIDARTAGLVRIADLQAQEKALAAEFERTERELYLTDLFIRTRVRLMEDRINGRFRLARFRMFEVQVNGAVAETCEVAVNGVPYSDLNRGMRLNVGLDCINTLAGHVGLDMPIFIDNAEAVTEILPTQGQQIRLVVSAADKTLRVEYTQGVMAHG